MGRRKNNSFPVASLQTLYRNYGVLHCDFYSDDSGYVACSLSPEG